MIRFRRPALPKSLQDRSTYHADSTRVSLAVATAPDCLRTPPSVPVCLFLPRKVGSMSEFESVITRGMTPVSEERREKAVLVGVDRPGASWPLASSLAELERLVDTAGADVAAVTVAKARRAESAHVRRLGQGRGGCRAVHAPTAADLVIFDDELTPIAANEPREGRSARRSRSSTARRSSSISSRCMRRARRAVCR